MRLFKNTIFRYFRESGNLMFSKCRWISAYAGMTFFNTPIMRINKIIFGLLLLAVYPLFTYADEPANNLYQINIIVFTTITAENLASEFWPDIKNPPNIGNIPDIEQISDQFSLSKELNKLSNLKNYNILLATAWMQQISGDQNKFHIYGGNNFGDNNEINGVIEITKNRYFQVTVNLVLTEPMDYLQSIGPGSYAEDYTQSNFAQFQMHQTIRLSAKQLAYLDHPLFGLLIQIVPLDMRQSNVAENNDEDLSS